jgi:hypothetical protein
MEGRHVGLDFFDLLIEVKSRVGVEKVVRQDALSYALSNPVGDFFSCGKVP